MSIGHMILMFLCAGIIPGTNIILTPMQMIVFIAVLASLVILRVSLSPILHKINLSNIKQNQRKIRRLSRV